MKNNEVPCTYNIPPCPAFGAAVGTVFASFKNIHPFPPPYALAAVPPKDTL